MPSVDSLGAERPGGLELAASAAQVSIKPSGERPAAIRASDLRSRKLLSYGGLLGLGDQLRARRLAIGIRAPSAPEWVFLRAVTTVTKVSCCKKGGLLEAAPIAARRSARPPQPASPNPRRPSRLSSDESPFKDCCVEEYSLEARSRSTSPDRWATSHWARAPDGLARDARCAHGLTPSQRDHLLP